MPVVLALLAPYILSLDHIAPFYTYILSGENSLSLSLTHTHIYFLWAMLLLFLPTPQVIETISPFSSVSISSFFFSGINSFSFSFSLRRVGGGHGGRNSKYGNK